MNEDYEDKIKDRKVSIAIMAHNYKIVKRCLLIMTAISIGFGWFLVDGMVKTSTIKDKPIEVFVVDSLFENNVYSMYDINKPFTIERLVSVIKDLSIQNPQIVLAQAILESGNFNSKLFLLNHNLFGMKKSYQRPSTHNDNEKRENYIKGYAFYTTWQNSVIDYALWQSGFSRNLTEEKYFEKLGRTYAEDTTYITKLKQIISQKKDLMSAFDKNNQ